MVMRSAFCLMLLTLLSACGQQSTSGRYQAVVAYGSTFVLDTATGCLDKLSFVDQQWSVNRVASYPDAQNARDKNELAQLTKEGKATDLHRFVYSMSAEPSFSCAEAKDKSRKANQ